MSVTAYPHGGYGSSDASSEALTAADPLADDKAIVAEVAGMIGDEIGDRLVRGGGDYCPPAVNWHPGETETVIDLEDGRRLRIAVTLEGETT